jgi:hypothetical protein
VEKLPYPLLQRAMDSLGKGVQPSTRLERTTNKRLLCDQLRQQTRVESETRIGEERA